jgi:hypothetical protein
MKHYNYIEKILDWAEERNLLTQGDVFMQLEKSREENSELTKSITKYEKGNAQAYDEIKDAIGDVYVTLVVASEIHGLPVYEIFKNVKFIEYDSYHWQHYTTWLRVYDWELYLSCVYGDSPRYDAREILNNYVDFLNELAVEYNFTLVECIEYAYNQIKERTGKIVDGTFVKDVK